MPTRGTLSAQAACPARGGSLPDRTGRGPTCPLAPRLPRIREASAQFERSHVRLAGVVGPGVARRLIQARLRPSLYRLITLLYCGTITTASRKHWGAMQFADKDIELFWLDPVANPPRRVPPNARKPLYRKLQILSAARELGDLRVPPGNRLEILKGNHAEQHSIRVNNQWRPCFIWHNGEATEVEFCDYH